MAVCGKARRGRSSTALLPPLPCTLQEPRTPLPVVPAARSPQDLLHRFGGVSGLVQGVMAMKKCPTAPGRPWEPKTSCWLAPRHPLSNTYSLCNQRVPPPAAVTPGMGHCGVPGGAINVYKNTALLCTESSCLAGCFLTGRASTSGWLGGWGRDVCSRKDSQPSMVRWYCSLPSRNASPANNWAGSNTSERPPASNTANPPPPRSDAPFSPASQPATLAHSSTQPSRSSPNRA